VDRRCVFWSVSLANAVFALGFLSSIDVHLYPTPGKVGHMLAKQMTWLVSVIFVLIMQNQPTYQALRFAGVRVQVLSATVSDMYQ
jgi:hypothetical protein